MAIAELPAVPQAGAEPVSDIRATRVAGAAGLVFAATVLFQNALRGSGPLNTASHAEVVSYYTSHHSSMGLLLASFGLGFAALLTFVAGLSARCSADNPASASW